MATTTNYGWAEPDNTSLVKNGAQDIRILGDAIDASVWNIGYGQAGKNKIINGDFGIWQRGTSISLSSGGRVYGADRFNCQSSFSAGTSTFSRQAFTAGTAPVAGYEGAYFGRLTAGSTATYFDVGQKIEDVRTFAGQPVTVSFWAKASASTAMSILLQQNFGSGGSASVDLSSAKTITTSWVRYTFSTTLASISGKTIGTGSHVGFYLLTTSTVTGSQTFDIWGVQVEYGSKATPFQTASGGSPQAELAMCQRYYWRSTASTLYGTLGVGIATSTTNANVQMKCPVTMRVTPTSIDYSTISTLRLTEGVGGFTCSGSLILSGESSPEIPFVAGVTSTGLTQYRTYFLSGNNSTTAFVGFSAEL
jgi:hypothetical protein